LGGELSVAMLAGEAGAGKTRLGEEFGRLVERKGDLFLKGGAVELQGADPYLPFVEGLHGMLGIRSGDSPEVRRQRLSAFLSEFDVDEEIFAWPLEEVVLGASSGQGRVSEDLGLGRHVLFEGIARLLQAAGKRRPVCFLLDDLQWGNQAVFELLDFLLERIGKARVLLVLAYRTEEIGGGQDGRAHPLLMRERRWIEEGGALRLEVGRLTEEAVAELVDGLRLDRERVGDLYRVTEGLALFVVESLKECLQEERAPGAGLPSRAREIIRYRLDRLDPEDRAVLRCASLLGERFDGGLLAEVMGVSRARIFLQLERLREVHQLLQGEEGSVYRFSHARIREKLQGEIPAHLRQIYCLAAGEVLERTEGDERVFDLAFLFREGEDWERAALYAARGAMRAAREQAFEEMERLARVAMDLVEGMEAPGGDVVFEVCRAAFGVWGRLVEQRDLIRGCLHRGLDLCNDPLQRADLHCWLADAGPVEERSMRLEEACREVGKRTDSLQMARVLRRQAKSDDLHHSLPLNLRALEIYERVAPEDPDVFGVYSSLLGPFALLEDSIRLEEYGRRFRRWARERQDPVLDLQVLLALANINGAQGLVVRHVEELEQALALVERMGHDESIKTSCISIYNPLFLLGEFDRAERHRARAERLGRVDLGWSMLALAADKASRKGRHELALQLLNDVLRSARDVSGRQGMGVFWKYAPHLGHAERVFFRADRHGDFSGYCRRLQEWGADRGGAIDGQWQGESAEVDEEGWEPMPGMNFIRSGAKRWVWEDPYKAGQSTIDSGEACIEVAQVVGFNAFKMPRLLFPAEGDFAVEVEVCAAEEVEAAQNECLERLREPVPDREISLPGAGGLLVCNRREEAVRLIAHLHAPGEVIFDVRRNGRCAIHGRTLVPAGPIVLRLERRGDCFRGLCKTVGGEWIGCGEIETPLGWKVHAGICAEMAVEFYYFARRVETRFSGFRFFRLVQEDRTAWQEEEMLRELREVLAEVGEKSSEPEELLLRGMGTAMEADWGRCLEREEQSAWKECCRWMVVEGEMAEVSPGLEGDRNGWIGEKGKVMQVGFRDSAGREIVWVLGREKPFEARELELLENTAPVAGMLLENLSWKIKEEGRRIQPVSVVAMHPGFPGIVGDSPAMKEVFQQVERVAPGAAPAMILGESGTGKEVIARAIHDSGPRKEKLFVAQNCAALPESLLESELFGYRRGAFTGAAADKPGLFEVASGGTIFLDEIVDGSPAVQAKLLRAVEEGEIRRVGDTESRKVDVRIISAASHRLDEGVKAGRLREDLFYRLNVVRVVLPALRERGEDVVLLAQFFLERICARDGKEVAGFTGEALGLLRGYGWPGNVRELQNEVERCATRVEVGGTIGAEQLSRSIREPEEADLRKAATGSLKQRVEELERTMIREALQRCGGNISRTARDLGVSRPGLHKKIQRYGLGK
jgi:Nif-specific regulatory protein